jgi:hypothetical protein
MRGDWEKGKGNGDWLMDKHNWLALTGEIEPTWTKITEELGAERVDAICAGRWYELSHATIAVALNLAIDQTGLTPRKRRRIGPAMLDIMFKVIPFVFMFGWMARGKAEDAN